MGVRWEQPSWQRDASAQDGVLSRAQALAGGLTRAAWQWRLDTGAWQALLPGVAVTHSGTPTRQQLRWAVVLTAGPGAALSGDEALVLHGASLQEPAVLHVAVPEPHVLRVRAIAHPGGDLPVVLHRTRGLADWVHPVRRPPVVRAGPALLHAAAWAPSDRAAEWRVAAAVQQRVVTTAQIGDALREMPKVHRRALVRAVLEDVRLGAHARSELDLLALLRRHGLPSPDRLQRPVRAHGLRYLDAWWERQRVAVEVDGAHHRSVGAWDADTLRANQVLVAGRRQRVLLLRFTTGNLRHDEPRVVAQLRAVL